MEKTWILNFEHDLALASNNPYYMPPKVATAMNEDMAPLAFWLSGNCQVLSQSSNSGLSDATLQLMQELGIGPKFRNRSVFEPKGDEEPMAWGWDPQVAKQFERLGIGRHNDLEHIRQWSHRGKTIYFLERFAEAGLFASEMAPKEASTAAEIETWTSRQQLVLKAPLSGSGRGIWWALNGYDFNVQRWSKRTLETQGSVLCEPIWEKTGDFAMEFECQDGETRFAGYSEFVADNAGVYRCNLLKPDEEIAATLAQKVGEDHLNAIKKLWIELLNGSIAPKYNGIVGIDMLTGRIDGGKEHLNPCVEINLRMTMGMAARLVFDRWICATSRGEFRTIHFKTESELATHAIEMREKCPIKLRNGRIEAGYALLTRETKGTKYGIEIEIE